MTPHQQLLSAVDRLREAQAEVERLANEVYPVGSLVEIIDSKCIAIVKSVWRGGQCLIVEAMYCISFPLGISQVTPHTGEPPEWVKRLRGES
jgi:hypothetical protein